MAKLKAHGEELARYRHPESGTEYALMSDRAVLKKYKGENWRMFLTRHQMARLGAVSEFVAEIKGQGFENVTRKTATPTAADLEAHARAKKILDRAFFGRKR